MNVRKGLVAMEGTEGDMRGWGKEQSECIM